MYRFFTHDWRLVEPLNTRRTLEVHFPMQFHMSLHSYLFYDSGTAAFATHPVSKRAGSTAFCKDRSSNSIKFNHLESFYARFRSLYPMISIKTKSL